jgi:putative transposase
LLTTNIERHEKNANEIKFCARGFPLHEPPHFAGIAGIYLITAACFEHCPVFDAPDLLSLLQEELLSGLCQAGLPLNAWVFLPNHYHVLLDTPDLACVSEALRKAHSRTAAKVNYIQNQKGRRVWYRYSDRLIRDERHYWATVNYIHSNPVKHGYVKQMTGWPWSSVHEYLESVGQEELRKIWRNYPIRDYGRGWDW